MNESTPAETLQPEQFQPADAVASYRETQRQHYRNLRRFLFTVDEELAALSRDYIGTLLDVMKAPTPIHQQQLWSKAVQIKRRQEALLTSAEEFMTQQVAGLGLDPSGGAATDLSALRVSLLQGCRTQGSIDAARHG